MLLPSQQLRDLAKTYDICLSGKVVPTNCDIRYRQMYWLMVFDQQGELRSACRLGEQLGVVTKQGFDVPNAFVEIVEEGLRAKTTLAGLKRAYVESRGSLAAFNALRKKIDEVGGVGQMGVANFLAETADQTKDPVLSHARSLHIESHACSHQVINHAALANLRVRIENFLEDNPGCASRGDVIDEFINVGLKYSFDVSAKCRAYAGKWSSDAAHRALGKLLLERCADVLASDKKKFLGMKPKAYGRLRLQARLGDVQVIGGLATTKSFGVMRPIHADWQREAKAKAKLDSK